MRKDSLLATDFRRSVPVAQKERRSMRRMSVTPQQVLPVVIRCGQGLSVQRPSH